VFQTSEEDYTLCKVLSTTYLCTHTEETSLAQVLMMEWDKVLPEVEVERVAQICSKKEFSLASSSSSSLSGVPQEIPKKRNRSSGHC